jgi:uncharacterized protein (DUF362 family)
MEGVKKTTIFLLRTENRTKGVQTLLKQFNLGHFKTEKIVLKANYNSADEFPASTHPETLRALTSSLKAAGAKEITLAERSGMGDTHEVLKQLGVTELLTKLNCKILVLDDLPQEGWVHFKLGGTHWKRGFLLAKVFTEADKVVQTCCLKTHRFGGHFTLSLKNSVGMVAKYDPKDGYNYMGELHSSRAQRLMIAEVNQAYACPLVLLDAIDAFVSGGPESGELIHPGVMLAGKDRIAIDAVGVAILRFFGTTPEVSRGRIFEQEQISRASQLGVGIQATQDIQLVSIGDESRDFARQIDEVLKLG